MTETLHESLAEALYAIRQEVGALPRDSENPHFKSKFTSLPVLVEKADPIAWEHGVLIHHTLSTDETGPSLVHELWFNGEKAEVYSIPLPNPQGTAQGLGSAVTYMRRYDIVTSLGLISEDDDGTAASAPSVAAGATQTRPAPTLTHTESQPSSAAIDPEF